MPSSVPTPRPRALPTRSRRSVTAPAHCTLDLAVGRVAADPQPGEMSPLSLGLGSAPRDSSDPASPRTTSTLTACSGVRGTSSPLSPQVPLASQFIHRAQLNSPLLARDSTGREGFNRGCTEELT